MVLCQLPLRLTLRNVAARLPRKYMHVHFQVFSQCRYHYSQQNYECICGTTFEYIHMCIQTPLAFNTLMWGSLRLVPIFFDLAIKRESKLAIHTNILYCKWQNVKNKVTVFTSNCWSSACFPFISYGTHYHNRSEIAEHNSVHTALLNYSTLQVIKVSKNKRM